MLQRRAKKIVWTISAFKALPTEVDACKSGVDTSTTVGLVADQLFDKFGFGNYSEDFLSNNQVFEQEEFQTLVCELQRLVRQGKPAVVRRPQMAVLQNSWWNIEPYVVDLVILYLAPCRDFEQRLPAETRDTVNSQRFFFDEVAQGASRTSPSLPRHSTTASAWPTLSDCRRGR